MKEAFVQFAHVRDNGQTISFGKTYGSMGGYMTPSSVEEAFGQFRAAMGGGNVVLLEVETPSPPKVIEYNGVRYVPESLDPPR